MKTIEQATWAKNNRLLTNSTLFFNNQKEIVMNINRIPVVLLAVLALIISACSVTVAPATKKQIDVTMVSHLTAGMPEQDVYVEVEPGSDQVQRITGEAYEPYLTRACLRGSVHRDT